jgi:predicted PurR-regulated permease PerM
VTTDARDAAPLPRNALRLANGLLGALLIAVLALQLLLALLAGLLAYVLHHALLRRLGRGVAPRWRQAVAMLAFWAIVAALVVGTIEGVQALGLGSPAHALVRLTNLAADSIERMRDMLPPWLAEHLPESIDSLRAAIIDWLRTHASMLRGWGIDTLRGAAHLLVGLVIGLLASIHGHSADRAASPFLRAWREGLQRLVRAFTGVMGAQVRIASINTALTAVYLLAIAPLLDTPVPLARTLVLLTFVCGLIPVLGNLVSNSAIVLASLSASPTLALLSLLYLIAIHKLEYFLNARIVGTRIQARTYELLAAMLLLEAVFGLRGVVAAPIYYAWLMGVLRDEGLA